MIRIKITILIVVLVLFSSALLASDVETLEVTSEIANIRSAAGMDGEIIYRAKRGDRFQVNAKKGSWYEIVLPEDQRGDLKFGFIHRSIVRAASTDMGDYLSELASFTKPKKISSFGNTGGNNRKSGRSSVPSRGRDVSNIRTISNVSSANIFKGKSIMFGWMTSPDADSFADKWILSFGSDRPIGDYFGWGFETQPYFRSYSSDYSDLSITTFASNLFINVKAGVNLGRFFKPLKSVSAYAGAGIGANVSFTRVEFDGADGNEFDIHFAWHLIFGTEIKLGKKTTLIVELQRNKIVVKDVDPATQSYGFMFIGLRF